VLNAKDSVLVNFALAQDNGSFAIGNLPSGKFILLVTYPDYADYVEQFSLDAEHPTKDFGNINLRQTARILHDVIVKGDVRAIKMKGDTAEFDPKAYVIQPNAKVEDLLKQLPGIQVDKDGKITANGEAVNKVLVDGEEFFGDDPTLVTKNIRADMVDKVQLYDKKSDQAAFTGIDDGQKTKTINIKLKEDKKNGAFGKISGGVGTDKYYESQLQYNKFKAKQKFSLYGILANDGKVGLSFDDANKLGAQGGNVQVGDDGSISIFFSSSDDLDSFSGTYSGRGLPTARSGGLHYDNKSADDKQTINFNYKVGSMQVDGLTNTSTEQKLPGKTAGSLGSVFDNNSSQKFSNFSFRQKADAAWTVKLDTAQTLKLTADATQKHFTVDNQYNADSHRNDTLVNISNRHINNTGNEQMINASALYTKKFKKPRRTFSWNVSESFDHNESDGFLNSVINFYHPGSTTVIDSVQKIDQRKTVDIHSNAINSNMTFTEPLSKYAALSFNYGFALNDVHSDKRSFNQSAPGVYDILDQTYTNDYQFTQITNQFGATFNYKTQKHTLNIGTKVSDVNFQQTDLLRGSEVHRNFLNWLPQATYRYAISQQSSFNLYYNGNTNQPTIDQIQPVRVNTDPLNITVGNADLKPSFNHRFNMSYNTYSVISGTSMFISANYSFTADQIVNYSITDLTTDKTTTQYVNLTNNTPYNYGLNASYSRKIKPIDLSVGIGGYVGGNVNYSFINGQLNQSTTRSYSPNINISKYVQKKFDFYVSGGPSYTINRFSVTPENNNNAPGFNMYSSGTIYLPAKFDIGYDMRYLYTGKTQTLDANQRTIMNARFEKNFFKDENLKLAFSVNNLFNQDVNFNRNVSGNTITQTTTTGIRRYFMFSVSYDFTKFATSASTDTKK